MRTDVDPVFAGRLCESLGSNLQTTLHWEKRSTESPLRDFFRSVQFRGLALLNDEQPRVLIPHVGGQLSIRILMHELGHVMDYYQIRENIQHCKAGEVQRQMRCLQEFLGDTEFYYLSEKSADYYGILLAAWLEIHSSMAMGILGPLLEEMRQDDETSQAEQIVENIYLEEDLLSVLTAGWNMREVLVTARRLTSTQALHNHVGHQLKLPIISRFFGYKCEISRFHPYVGCLDTGVAIHQDLLAMSKEFAAWWVLLNSNEKIV